MIEPYFNRDGFYLYNNDCNDVMSLYHKIDMIFADPPYFLSNNGLTINHGNIVSVNKGEWDKTSLSIDEFNYKWLKGAHDCLAPNGTIWICGSIHNIFSVVKVLDELGFKILNAITWKKTNPPPNFTCRCFTHSTEILIWARREKKVAHYFNYDLMKQLNGGKQMKDVWEFPAIARWEKAFGKHPTQKPLSVVCRTILAASKENDIILDPFSGSCTTGIASVLLKRKFIGADICSDYLNVGIERYIQATSTPDKLLKKIRGLEGLTFKSRQRRL